MKPKAQVTDILMDLPLAYNHLRRLACTMAVHVAVHVPSIGTCRPAFYHKIVLRFFSAPPMYRVSWEMTRGDG